MKLIETLSTVAWGMHHFGSVITGGLVVATLFTLLLVPSLFSLVLDLKLRLAGEKNGRME